MTKPTRLPAQKDRGAHRHGCPFRLREFCSGSDCTRLADSNGDEARYIQVRRQGLYLAACIVDDVAGLGMRNPEAVIDEIRRRICELVRCELK